MYNGNLILFTSLRVQPSSLSSVEIVLQDPSVPHINLDNDILSFNTTEGVNPASQSLVLTSNLPDEQACDACCFCNLAGNPKSRPFGLGQNLAGFVGDCVLEHIPDGDIGDAIRALDTTLREANLTFDSRNEILSGFS